MRKKERNLFKKVLLCSLNYEYKKIHSISSSDILCFEEKSENFKSLFTNYRNNANYSHKRVVKIILITAFIIALSATIIACIPKIRNLIIGHYLVKEENGYYDVISLPNEDIENETGEEVESPLRTHIEQQYLPEYLPENYTEFLKHAEIHTVQAIWMHETDMIVYQQSTNSEDFLMDAEADFSETNLAGHKVNFWTKHSLLCVIFGYDGYIIVITLPESLGLSEAEKIIASINPATIPIE